MEAPVYHLKRVLESGGCIIYLYLPRIQLCLEVYTNKDVDVNLPEMKRYVYMRTCLVSLSWEEVETLLKRLEDESFVRKFEQVLRSYPIITANIVAKAIEDVDTLLKRRGETIVKKEFEERVRRRHVESYWQLLRAWRTEHRRDDPTGKIMRLEKGWVTVYDKDPEYFYVLYLTDDGELYEHRTKDILRSELAFAYLLEGRRMRSFRERSLQEIPKDVARVFAKLLKDASKEELLVSLAV